ncbi:MAG: threonylcarbamoyl-AMP synthase [Parasporobacterium sp.]|nr:threonylcarbamoyl-AMP synthase [Parasporobacterium sp.]
METRILKYDQPEAEVSPAVAGVMTQPAGHRSPARIAGEILRNGGIVAFPTDTVYGLGAVYSDAQAVRKIFAAKGRPENKPLSILVSGPQQAEQLALEVSPKARKLMEAFWPGALTIIFRRNPQAGIPEEVTAGGDTIGVRMPESRAALEVIREAGAPVAAPSANRSGKRSAASARDVIEDLDGRIDLIIDGGSCPVGISSTVLDFTEGTIRILREGTITRAMIEEVLAQ